MISLREASVTGVARLPALEGSAFMTTEKGSVKSPGEVSMSKI